MPPQRPGLFTNSPAPAASPGVAGRDREGQALHVEAMAVELRRRSQDAELGAAQFGVDAELWVDPAVWASTLDAIRTASVELHQRACPPRTPGTIRVSVSALLFPMTTPVPAPDDG